MIIIDLFEGNIAVLEFDEQFWSVPRAWLPNSAKEGDIIVFTAVVDEKETQRRRNEIEKKLNDLFD